MPVASNPSTTSHAAIHGFRFDVLGCSGHIRLAGVPRARAERAVAEVVAWLRGVEARFTRFRDHSLVGRLNCAGEVPLDVDFTALLAAAGRAWRVTAGRFDATALPLWRLWHDSARVAWPDAGELAAARALVDWTALVVDDGRVSFTRPGMALDLGGVGKEWCVDQVVARLQALGIADLLVELGGDCAARGRQPGRDGWLVLLPGAAAAIALHDEALATSGISTRTRMLAGRAVAHLIDAASGQPASGVLRSVSVLAGDCLTAGIHASDVCLVARADPAVIATRAADLPTWSLAADGALLADQRLLARVHPVDAGEDAA